MNTTVPRVVIVDGFGPGRALLAELLERNVECLHLWSRDPPAPVPFDTRDYDADVGFAGDVSAAIHLLTDFEPSSVVAGSLRATAYAEAVADGLGLPTHAIEGYGARRAAQSLLLSARPEAGPVLVQPAQFVGAPQYVVNTVSAAGLHRLSDAWRLADFEDSNVSGPGALELCDGPEAAGLTASARTILDGLGVRHGAAHLQLAVTDTGPCLVGAAACVAAFGDPGLAGLPTQAAVWADHLAVREPSAPARGPERHVTILLFRFRRRGRVDSLEGLARLKTLPSFLAHERPLALGDTVKPCSTWLAPGGHVYLSHDSAAQIGVDVRQFRAWEAGAELYGLAPLQTCSGGA